MLVFPRQRRTRAAASVAILLSLLFPATAFGQSSLSGNNPPQVVPTTVAPPTSPTRCIPVGFSAGWELAYDTRANMDRSMQLIRDAGGQYIRFVVDWSDVEWQRGSYNWSRADNVIQAAGAKGVKVLVSIAYTPQWARSSDGDRNSSHTRPAKPSDYGAFARLVAQRYPQVTEFEIWNEPNLQQFWLPRPNPAHYAELVKAAYPAIKGVRPDANVMAGGLAASGDDGVNIPGPRFVTQMYAAGAGGSFDSVSFHPYNYPDQLATGQWNTMGMSDQIYQTMTSRGDGAKKIWFTEYGVPTGLAPRSSSEAAQGQTLANGIVTASTRAYVGGMLLYTLKDYGADAYNLEQNFGILRNDFSKKAGWSTVASQMARSRC